jgi:hypothetical protein
MTTFDSANALAAVVSIDPDVAEFQATLPILVERASRALLEARSSAEVLEARDMATVAYDAAKSAGRLARAKKAHEAIIAAVYRAQADALLIEARAKMRLADEYDAAQERGEVKSHGGSRVNVPSGNVAPSAAEVGLNRKEIHEGRKLRDAEKSNPGKAERVLKEVANRGEEPTKAKLRKEVTEKPAAPAKAPAEPIDPERRKLAKLTPDALIDEVLGLRADLIEAKAELAKMKTERDALKAQVKDLSATDSGAVIRKLQAEADNAKNAKWREGEKALAFQKQIYALKKELKTLGATEIPL